MVKSKVEIKALFETSWEVCNKVGGIYTVLSSKAKNLQTLYKDKVIFIGPDLWDHTNTCPVFKESATVLRRWRESAHLPYDIKVRTGRWEVPGRPIAILIGFKGLYAVKDKFYGSMWQKFGVDSLHAYGDYDEACAFSLAAGMVIESIADFYGWSNDNNVIAHFDEWTTGMGLLYVKDRLPSLATVFTTHATSIGRSICGNGKDLYRYFKGYNGDQMARELNMEAKHSLEKTAAHQADCFTTVSDITAAECEQLLDKRPDMVTPNGFEENFVPNTERALAIRRNKARKKLLAIASALTGNTYQQSTLIVATSGRCEYRNKGLDIFIDAVNTLSSKEESHKKVVAFIMVPAWVKEARVDLQQALQLHTVTTHGNKNLTHWLNNPQDDPVALHIDRTASNRNSDTHIIYVPCYLNGVDGIFDMPYYDLLVGMDATVFPSYYEPWGYTPLESVAFGVPTITTSLSGFGRWIIRTSKPGFENCGVAVVPRDDTNYTEVCHNIADTLARLALTDSSHRNEISLAARRTAQTAAWDYFIEYYVDAYNIAIQSARHRRHNKTDK